MKKIFMAALVGATALLTACNGSSPRANLKSDVDTLSYELGVVMSGDKSDFAMMLAQQGSDSAYVEEFLKGFADGMKAADDKKKMAYNLGLQNGMQLKMQMPNLEAQVFQGDSTKKVNVNNYLAGFIASANKNVTLKIDGKPVDKETANKHLMEYMFGKQKKASADFMAAKAKEAGVKKLANGILYKEISAGSGDKRCTLNDSIIIKYEGKLPDGNVFDKSDRHPEGVTMSLKNVIKGWQTAIPQMPVGATWEIYIPYDQAYGENGSGPIPPFSALTFKVTLVGIK